MQQAIGYYRVSTDKQGKSGLGLEAQQSAVEEYCDLNDYLLFDDVTEVKSTRKYREGLYDALKLCKKNKATLVVAKLDRLGRDVEQVARVIKTKVDIVITEYPNADPLVIHIMAAVAEDQRRRISLTTKEALRVAKKRGVELGKNGKVLAILNKQAANDFALKLSPIIQRLNNRGIVTVRAITKELNKKAVPTFRGSGKWHATTVHALIKRLNEQQLTDNKKINSIPMQTANQNDILFDDVAFIKLADGSNQSAQFLVQYGDCNNRYEIATAENLSLKANNTGYSKPIQAYGDCNN